MSTVWAGQSCGRAWSQERIVPSGQAHLSFRPCGTPIRLGRNGEQVERGGVLAGPRGVAHVHDRPAARTLGVILRAGAVPALFGEAASAVAGQHVGLTQLWGADADRLNEQLADADDEAALRIVEDTLVAKLRPMHVRAGLADALRWLSDGARVAEVAAQLGCSERALRSWFEVDVGLSPKAWSRVRRVRRALAQAEREPDWSTVAHRVGYVDQAHLCREVRDVVGITPSQCRAHVVGEVNHIPVIASDLSKRGAGMAR